MGHPAKLGAVALDVRELRVAKPPWFEYHLNQTNHDQPQSCRS